MCFHGFVFRVSGFGVLGLGLIDGVWGLVFIVWGVAFHTHNFAPNWKKSEWNRGFYEEC